MMQSATVRLVFCQVTQHTPSVEDCTMSQRDRTNCLTSIYEAGESRSAQSVNESECYATQDRASRELPYALLLHTRVHRHTAKCQHLGSLIFSKKGSGRCRNPAQSHDESLFPLPGNPKNQSRLFCLGVHMSTQESVGSNDPKPTHWG